MVELLVSFGRKIVFLTILLLPITVNGQQQKYNAKVIMVEDHNLLPLLLADLNQAQISIDCAIYIFKIQDSETTSELIANALVDAANRDVDIAITLDNIDDISTKFNTHTGKRLKNAGINVYYSDTSQKLHAKICVIDDITYIGSHNYTFSAIEKNHEMAVRIESNSLSDEVREYIREIKITSE